MIKANSDLENFLLNSIRGEGENVVFSQGDVEEGRKDYSEFFGESIRTERYRSAEARTSASEIYLD
jgi:hypothetical protein